MTAALGDPVTLRALWWASPVQPEPGDLLQTDSGRRYLVLEVRPQRNGRPTMRCLVIQTQAGGPAIGAPAERARRVWRWTWADRRQRQALARRAAARA